MTLSPSGNPNPAPPNPITSTTFEGVPPPEVFVRDGQEPVAAFLWAEVFLAG